MQSPGQALHQQFATSAAKLQIHQNNMTVGSTNAIQQANVHQINTRSIGVVNADASGDNSPNARSRKSDGAIEIV